MENKPDWKTRLKPWRPFLFGAIAGVVGYFVGKMLAQNHPDLPLLSWIGGPNVKNLSAIDGVALILALMWVAICALSAVLFALTGFNKRIGDKTGVIQLLGTGKSGRRSLMPMTIFYLASAGSIILLGVSEFMQLSPTHAMLVSIGGAAMAIIMTLSGIVLMRVLDELVLKIWLEALALTGLVFLLLTTAYGTAAKAGVLPEIGLFAGIMYFHAIYLVVYVMVTAKRAPESLGILDDEDMS